MSILFDREETEVDQVIDRAHPPAMSMAKPLALLVLVSGAAFAVTQAPLVAGAVGLPFTMNLFGKLKKHFRNGVFVHQNPDCLAHLIRSDRDMATYLKEFGKDVVATQLSIAMNKNQRFTRTAKKTAQKLLGGFERPTLEALLEELAPTPEAEEQADSASASVTEAVIDINAYNPQWFDPGKGGSLPLAVILASPYSSYLMIGGQRTGKSYFAAVASRELTRTGAKVYHINLASYGDEDAYYWTHATRSVTGDLSTITDADEAQALIDDALAVVTEFWSAQDAILICDEITLAGSKHNTHSDLMGEYLKTIAGKISSLTTTGMKRRKAIWCLCPELVAGALQDAAKSIKSLKLCYFGISPGQFADWEGQAISFDHSLHQQIKANWTSVEMPSDEQIDLLKAHSIDRIVWMGEQWLPVGELPKIEPTAVAASPEVYGDHWKQATDNFLAPIGATLTEPTATKVPAKVAKVELTEEEMQNQVYEKLCAKLIALNGEKITLAKLKKNLSTKQQGFYSQLVEDLILEDERFDTSVRDIPNGAKSISIWLKAEINLEDESPLRGD
jgi:hypothetical protein